MRASEVEALLGVSARQVYELAAPCGPIPCLRIGRRVVFEEADVLEFKQSCRSTATANVVRSSLSSIVVSPVRAASELASAFRKLGLEPKLMPSTGRNRPASTP